MSVLAASASDGSCKSAVSSWLRYRATLSSSCPRRRSTLARVKLRSIVDGLELAPVDGDARFGEQTLRHDVTTPQSLFVGESHSIFAPETSTTSFHLVSSDR